ncbi:MAG: hypothetical protein ACJA1C_002868 [Crocinitomicaceae bacterium]|jgi:hypothetical protein
MAFAQHQSKWKLKEGLWFYGNDSYLALSFWNSMDWMNKTPNNSIILQEDIIYLDVSIRDSPRKRELVEIRVNEGNELDIREDVLDVRKGNH